MGLVQREIEAAGIATIILSPIPDLTAAVSVPRLAGIAYPCGSTFGQPHDVAGQRAVLTALLSALTTLDRPGGAVMLPFVWPESPKEVRSRAHASPPIGAWLQRHPWDLPRLLFRKPPTSSAA